MEDLYLGIDPSTTSTGYAVVNSKLELIEYGKVVPENISKELTPAEEMLVQFDAIKALLLKYPFKKVLCEDQFFGENVDTLKKLSRVTGMFLVLSAQHELEIDLIYPSSWRKVYHGTGKAKKRDTCKKVNEDYGLKLRVTKDNDISDAIGIAVTAAKVDAQGE